MDLELSYTLTAFIQPGHGDRICLYKLPYLQPHEYVSYVWTKVSEEEKTLMVNFSVSVLPKEEDFYQFQYLKGDNQVAGASVPFQLRLPGKSHQEVTGVKEEDDLLVVQTPQTSLQEKYTSLLDLSEKLTEELNKKNESFIVLEQRNLSLVETNTKVQEKSAARQEYREAMDNRQTAVIMEETKQDSFEAKVGHLSSGASCEIKIVYTMELPVELGMTKITIPTTVAPRYVPMTDGSYEALKITSIKHDFNSPVKMTLSLDVMMQKEIVSVTSPSHKIEITNQNKMAEYFVTTAKFDGDTTQMDRDLIVFVKSEDSHKPRVMVEKDEEDSHVAMLTFVPDFKLAEHKVEAIFLVDCSGSMSGSSMNLAKEALLVFIHSLPVSSYFNVILFGSNYKSLFPESRIYNDHTFQDAKTSIQGKSSYFRVKL